MVQKTIVTALTGLLLLLVQVGLSWPDDYAHVIFCDVGQGDAILITSGWQQVLVDGGRGGSVLRCLEEYIPWWDRQLDLVVATHADADHIGGLDEVLENYHVLQVISPRFQKETGVFDELKAAISEEQTMGSQLKEPILGQQIVFSRGENTQNQWWQPQNPVLEFEIISPLVASVPDEGLNEQNPEEVLSDINLFFNQNLAEDESYNNLSVGLLLTIGQVDFLLTGDIEAEGEVALLEAGLLRKVEVLKVGHHGSKTSTTTELLTATRPELAVLSVGKYNDYGHPSLEVMDRLTQFDSQILSTAEWGDIEIQTDGHRYWWVESSLR